MVATNSTAHMIAAIARIALVGITACCVGVGQAGDQPGVLGGQRVAVQPVAGGPDQDERGQQQRQVHARGGRGALAAGLQLQAAVHVVGERGGDQRQHDDHASGSRR